MRGRLLNPSWMHTEDVLQERGGKSYLGLSAAITTVVSSLAAVFRLMRLLFLAVEIVCVTASDRGEEHVTSRKDKFMQELLTMNELTTKPSVAVLESIEAQLEAEDAPYRQRSQESAAAIAANTDVLSLDWLPLEERRILPNVPGIYFVLENDRVIYIGLSRKSILRRWWNHSKLSDLSERRGEIKIAWLECRATELLSTIESALITRFGQPELNLKKGARIVPLQRPRCLGAPELDDNIERRLLALRRTDWQLVKDVADKLQISNDDALMWIIRVGAAETPRRYSRMLKKLDQQVLKT